MDDVKIIVFDIGGTLMEYKNMPNVWIEYYQNAFYYVKDTLHLNITDNDICLSVEKLKQFNPRIKYREIEYSPKFIFTEATKHWNCAFVVDEVINTFFASMNLTAYTYPETINVLNTLKAKGYKIGVLTDVATGMPDELHKSYVSELLPYFDMYVSSVSCGYRKPNPKGLQDIADAFSMTCDNMVFVGDEEKDIKTAERFGSRSVLINRSGTQKDFGQSYTINNLNELIRILNSNQNPK